VIQRIFDFGIIANIFIHGFEDALGSFKPVVFQFSVILVKWFFLYILYRKNFFLKV